MDTTAKTDTCKIDMIRERMRCTVWTFMLAHVLGQQDDSDDYMCCICHPPPSHRGVRCKHYVRGAANDAARINRKV